MNAVKLIQSSQPCRRDFLKGLSVLGASALTVNIHAEAQSTGADVRMIDIHHHYVSPAYTALATRKNDAWPQFKDYTPTRHLEEMDKSGIATGMVSPTAPSV